MKEKWDECDALETARRLIDLGVVREQAAAHAALSADHTVAGPCR